MEMRVKSLTLRKSKKKFIAEVKVNDELVFSQRFDRYNARDQNKVAGVFAWDKQKLLVAIGKLEASEAEEITFDVEEQSPPAFTIRLRPVTAVAGTSTTYPSLETALAAVPPPDSLLEWDGREQLACLDVDYHAYTPPSGDWLADMLYAAVEPKPSIWHLSHGGGLHCFYEASGGFTADELAAVAALAWLRLDGRATCDIVTQARHPASRRTKNGVTQVGGPVNRMTPTTDVATLASAVSAAVSPEDVSEWLDGRGWKPGQTLEHDFCPIDPCASHGLPVFIGDAGVYCHKCAATGRSHGSRRPGFVPWATLVPGGVDPVIVAMAKKRCHWQHASAVMAARLRVGQETARLCYSALLKLLHSPDDPRLPGVFTSGVDLIRLDDRWTTADASKSWQANIAPTLAKLPATQFIDGAGNVRSDTATVNRLQQPHDLTDCGYPALSVVRGVRVYGQHLTYTDEERTTVVCPSSVVRAAGHKYAPRYVDKKRRLTPEEYQPIFHAAFPGLNWEYLKLLIAAKGAVEDRVGMPPMLLVDGPAGSAKSATVLLAAAVTGDVATEVVFSTDTVRFRQSIMSAVEAGTFMAVNEILKDGRRFRLTATQTLDPILNLTEGSTSHVLYVGPVALGRMPVIVLTDINVPDEVRADVQLARRLTHVHQSSRVDWETTLLDTEIRDIRRFRVHSEVNARACDALLSDVIDTFFGVPMTFSKIAGELGFTTLEKSTDFESPEERLLEFFRLVCDAPPVSGSYAKRYASPGWKMISRGHETPLAEAWDELHDGDTYTDSRKCRERDWSALLGTSKRVVFDVAAVKDATVMVRFRVGDRTKPDAVNEGVL